MSIASTLALMVTAFVKPDSPDVEITRLKAQIDNLERQLADIRRDCDSWMDIAQHWRGRYELMHCNVRTQQAVAQQAQAQYLAQQQHLAQQVGFQLEGAGLFCNCVPARHDVLLSG
jgi:hypothetical protein